MTRKSASSDFRYNTGDTKVPWAAVGENYNAADALEFVKFLMQGKGAAYNAALRDVKAALAKLGSLSTPPGKLSMGDKVAEVERAIDRYLGVDEGSSLFVSNCTAALELGYRYAGVGPGDEVIVPTNTFIATVAYPLSVGAKLVFADVDPKTVNIDPKDIARKITKRTKIIVPVHIGGYPCDMDAIMRLAKKHGIVVMEDAAHGFGGVYKGRKLGTIGHFGCFSMHEVKNCTSFGEGGVFVSNVPEYRAEARRARFLGVDFSSKIKNWLYNVSLIKGKGNVRYQASNNASVTEIQAVALLQQLKRYGKVLAERRREATYMTKRLSGVPGILPQDLGSNDIVPTFHLYQLQIDPKTAGGDVQTLKAKLEKKGVTNIPHFGPIYRFAASVGKGFDEKKIAKTCPVTEYVFDKCYTHLPIYGLTKAQLDYMADAILSSVAEMKAGK
ncbi:MAG: DegT/DnrJ/EryC1/StrS family aminotransferase [Kiritimatiellae bacterium]|nr:DegT/DnrJ/EryC1/StrS family aminotransferase [Kiritimatiellia bacterium]